MPSPTLPNADRAFVDLEKLRGYCLNPAHPRGRHKARVFRAACGATARHAEHLRAALLAAARRAPAQAQDSDAHGRRFWVDFLYEGPTAAVRVRSSWIIRRGDDFPRFVSCYVLT